MRAETKVDGLENIAEEINGTTATVLDDDEFFRFLFARIFTMEGIAAEGFTEPGQLPCCQPGVGACPSTGACVDFFLTDLRMPGMSGIELLTKLRELGCKIPDERKAITSANWLDEEIEQASTLANRVFFKSDSIEQLTNWVSGPKGPS